MREQFPEFQRRGVAILAISNEDQKRGAKLKEKLDLPFPLLADSERQIIQAYGVFHHNEPKGRPISRPATFVLDTEGVIRYRYVGDSPPDRPAAEAILDAIPARESEE